MRRGRRSFAALAPKASDQLAPSTLYTDIIDTVADQHAIILNRMRNASMILPGQSLAPLRDGARPLRRGGRQPGRAGRPRGDHRGHPDDGRLGPGLHGGRGRCAPACPGRHRPDSKEYRRSPTLLTLISVGFLTNVCVDFSPQEAQATRYSGPVASVGRALAAIGREVGGSSPPRPAKKSLVRAERCGHRTRYRERHEHLCRAPSGLVVACRSRR